MSSSSEREGMRSPARAMALLICFRAPHRVRRVRPSDSCRSHRPRSETSVSSASLLACPGENTIADYLRGSLAPEAMARMEEHLDGCAECRWLVAELARPCSSSAGAPTEVMSTEPRGSDEAPLTRGTAVGRYLIVERIGAGGMGIVYAAYDPELDRKIAIKLLRSAGDLQVRLLREARSVARLSHPNVIAVFDVGLYDDRVFLAMELLSGGTLRSWSREGKRSWKECLAQFIKAGRGLEAAHSAGVIHRDFKPDNVLVDANGRVCVTDFGLARSVLSEERTPPLPVAPASTDETLTREGALVGTPAYMAPEQIRGEPADARTDLFTFCVALYESLYGQRPFAGGSLRETLEEMKAGRIRPPPKGTKVPSRLARILFRGLSFEPGERFQSLDALLDELERFSSPSSRRWLVAAALVASASIGLAGWVAIERRRHLCQGSEQLLAGVWDPPSKSAIQQAFRAVQRRGAEDAFAPLEKVLDSYASAWVAGRTEACQATRVRGEQSEQTLELRMLCFDRRLKELKALARRLREADQKTVESAIPASYGLTNLSACSEAEAVAAGAWLPSEPSLAESVAQLRLRLADARVLRLTGNLAGAKEQAAKVVDQARVLGFRPLLAEALRFYGHVLYNSFDVANAERVLHEGVAVADALHYDEVSAQAWIELVWCAGLKTDADRAEEIAQHARAAIERMGGNKRLEADLENAMGSVALRLGRPPAEGLAHFQRARALAQEVEGERSPTAIRALHNMATALDYAERDAESVDVGLEALKLVEKVYGPQSATWAVYAGNVAHALRKLDRLDEALDFARRALTLVERTNGENHPEGLLARLNIGEILLRQGKASEALAMFERSRAIMESAPSKYRDWLAEAESGIGRSHLDMGASQAAIDWLERSLKTLEAGPSDPRDFVTVRFALARALWESKRDLRRALALAAKARENALEIGGPAKADAEEIERWLGERGGRKPAGK